MSCRDRCLKTAEIAEALGVSVSSVKRWVDQGRIAADRTAGNHRLITPEEVDRFAKSCGLTLRRALEASDLEPLPNALDDFDAVAELTALLKAGEGSAATRVIRSFHRAAGTAELASLLIRPVMHAIGHEWESGDWDVYQEHQASVLVAKALQAILTNAESVAALDDSAPVALGATPEGDVYSLSLVLGEILLREAGWRIRNLGSNLPSSSLIEAMRAYRPRLVYYSVSHLPDPAGFVRGIGELSRVAEDLDVHILIGGRALGEGLRDKLRRPRVRVGDRLDCLAEFAQTLAPSTRSRTG